MRDIFHPGEQRQKIVDIRKNSKKIDSNFNFRNNVQTDGAILTGNKNKQEIKSGFLIANNRKNFSAKSILIMFIILIFTLASFMIYYFLFINKKNEIKNADNQDPDLIKFEENLNEIESSSVNLDKDPNDIDQPTIDFNTTL